MKISYRWLKDYIDTDLSPEEIGATLTDTGLEVEGLEKVETVKGGLAGLVIGHVLSKEKHPDADRLNVCQVNVGAEELLTIVCGAPNVDADQKVVVAPVGTTIHPTEGDSFKIKRSKIRGVESQGMICAEDEIGLGTDHDGIMVLDADAPVGKDARSFFKVEDDFVFEIGLTPNRADGMSHVGVARDLAAALSRETPTAYRWPSVDDFAVDAVERTFDVQVESEACPRYAGLTLTDVKVGPSPEWLQNRLRSIGVNTINNIVDVTNYVLHEMGQPLHAFDGDQIPNDKVIVKCLPEGSTFVTLDEVERKLSAEDLMICNTEGGMCIAGVFGGIKSGVTDQTNTIFLESAWFDPGSVRKSVKKHQLHTDAGYRFERGVDPNITIKALKRAAMLMKEVAGARIVSEIGDYYPNPIENVVIDFSYDRCHRLIGKNIPEAEIRSILESLEFVVREEKEAGLLLEVPAYRNDVTREADVIEEVLRIYGFNNIEDPAQLRTNVITRVKPDREQVRNRVADLLAANGYLEMLNNSLTNAKYHEHLAAADYNVEEAVGLLNPLSSELEVMRQTMLFGALESMAYNHNRKQHDLKVFEFGKVYRKTEKGYREHSALSLALTGRAETESWNHRNDQVSFYELKGMVNKVIERLGINKGMRVQPSTSGLLEDGLTYNIANKEVVHFGWIKPSVAEKFEVKTAVFYAEFNWDVVVDLLKMNKVRYREVSRYPAVRRDLSLLLDKGVQFAQIEQIARKCEKQLLKEVSLFDVYQGKNLEPGKKSYAVSFILQDSQKTLQDKQIEKIMAKIQQAAEQELGAVIR